MNNIEFENFKRKNGYGSSEKYNKDKNNTYCRKNMKPNIFTLRDWRIKSEYCISHFVYDTGKGDFTSLGQLDKELNKTLDIN